jgi:hypothetical protein
MKRMHFAPLGGAAIFALTALLAACGGGGGGSTGGGGGIVPPGATPTPTPGATATPPGATPTPLPTATPAPTPTPVFNGTASIGASALANATVAFTCGCSGQAGRTTTNGSGAYSFTGTATPVPLAPNPTYTTVPGRNYLIVAYNPANHAQSWTMGFLGKTPATTLSLAPSNGMDAPATAAALYVFANSPSSGNEVFDAWNYTSIATYANKLRTGPTTAAETKLMNDIVTQQNAGNSLYTTIPSWNPDSGATTNATIAADLNAVKTSNSGVPTPCPGGAGSCTGTPTP